MSDSTEQLSRKTVRVAPALGPILAEHLSDNFDEMLPHLYFGDLSRWVVEELSKEQPSADVTKLLALLESSYIEGDEDVQDLIDASFIEMVEDEPLVTSQLGPALRGRVQR